MKNEVLIIGKDNGLSNSKTQELLSIITPLIEVEAQWNKTLNLIVSDENDLVTMQSAKGARLVIKNQRIEAEKFIDSKRKEVQELMSEYVSEDKALLKIKQLIVLKAKEYETHLEKQEKFAENLNKIREDELFKRRYDKMLYVHENPGIFNLRTMTESAFEQLYNDLKKQKDEEIELAREAFEKERRENLEKAEMTALINSRMQALFKYKTPNDSLNGDLGKISEEEFNALLKSQILKHEVYLKEENKRKKELEEKERELKAKNEELNRLKLIAEEQERIKEEERVKNETLMKAPLKERLNVFVNSFSCNEINNINDVEVKKVYDDIMQKFNGFRNWALSQIEKM